MSFCVPEDNFSVCDVSSQLTHAAELQSIVSNMDAQWAFRGTGQFGPDGWLLLQRSDVTAFGSHPVIAVCIQSNYHMAASSTQPGKLGEEAGQLVHVLGVDRLMVYDTQQHQTLCCEAAAKVSVPLPRVVVGKDCLPAYYSACIALLSGAL